MIQPINNSQPTFGKYAIIQVPHKAFKNPKNYLAVEEEFVRICEKAIDMPSAWKCKIADFFGKAICPKFDAYLESPNFPEMMKSLKDIGGYSIDWVKLHTGADIKPPKREDYHSFIVLTGDEFDRMSEACLDESKQEEREDFMRKKIDNFKNSGRSYSKLLVDAIVNEIAVKEFEEVFADTKPAIVEISELSELPELVKTMME